VPTTRIVSWDGVATLTLTLPPC